ncbi:hypothetical protein CRM22_002348, partial [Opisthorchis felineus]
VGFLQAARMCALQCGFKSAHSDHAPPSFLDLGGTQTYEVNWSRQDNHIKVRLGTEK